MPDNHLDVQPADTAIQGDHDDILIRLVASALFRLAESAERGETLSAPYPRLLQRALDRLAVTCLLRIAAKLIFFHQGYGQKISIVCDFDRSAAFVDARFVARRGCAPRWSRQNHRGASPVFAR